MQPRIPIAFFVARAHFWFMFYLVYSRTLRAFSVKLLSSWVFRVVSPRYRTLHFPLLNFMRFLLAHSSSLSKSLWMAV